MLKDVLRKARKEKGLTLDETARLVGLSRGTIFKLEKGEVKSIKSTAAERFSAVLGIPLQELIGSNEGSPYETGMPQYIPVFEHVGCGVPAFGSDDVVDYIPFDGGKDASEYFALVARGDSMEPLISNGDILVMKKQNVAETGDFAAVRIGDEEFLLKKVVLSTTGMTLKSLNDAYSPICYSWDDVGSLPVNVIGKLKEVRKQIR